MSKVQITCFHFWSDWTDMIPREIDLDEWDWFELQYRGDRWFIIGWEYDRKREKWDSRDLSDHGVVGTAELAKFANVAGDKINKITTNNSQPHLIKLVSKLYEFMIKK